MMSECTHVQQPGLAAEKSFLNPRAWSCRECGTTNSVWACLHCDFIGCDTCDEGHAHQHFDSAHHSIVLEINHRTLYCYDCQSDLNPEIVPKDVRAVVELLDEIHSQSKNNKLGRGRRTSISRQISIHLPDLNPSSHQEEEDREMDQVTTAERHWKYTSLAKSLSSWIQFVAMCRKDPNENRKRSPSDDHAPSEVQTPPPPRSKRKKLTPGVTGLRNLGNTCYMNSILQALSHIAFFREYLRMLGTASSQSCPESPHLDSDTRRQLFLRQTTVECFQHISHRPNPPTKIDSDKEVAADSEAVDGSAEDHVSLCNGLYELLRVMWSGKWATVTPHTFLNTVWKTVPSFYGFDQQDAQEFLCEFLCKMQSELDNVQCSISLPTHHDPVSPKNLLALLFEGSLVSRIACDGCGRTSSTVEPFVDLSLDFPVKYHTQPAGRRQSFRGKSLSLDICKLVDLLALFNAPEALPSYSCDHCCTEQQRQHKPTASKCMFLKTVPNVLRLHLKRFRWQGRSYTKIKQHLTFPFELSIKPFVEPVSAADNVEPFYLYDLSSVVVHHGSGFSSGHYTSYCWNPIAESWVLCNDSRMSLASPHEVERAQAYMLIYVRRYGCSGPALGYCLPHTPLTPIMPSPLQRYSLSFAKKTATSSLLKASQFAVIHEEDPIPTT